MKTDLRATGRSIRHSCSLVSPWRKLYLECSLDLGTWNKARSHEEWSLLIQMCSKPLWAYTGAFRGSFFALPRLWSVPSVCVSASEYALLTQRFWRMCGNIPCLSFWVLFTHKGKHSKKATQGAFCQLKTITSATFLIIINVMYLFFPKNNCIDIVWIKK